MEKSEDEKFGRLERSEIWTLNHGWKNFSLVKSEVISNVVYLLSAAALSNTVVLSAEY